MRLFNLLTAAVHCSWMRSPIEAKVAENLVSEMIMRLISTSVCRKVKKTLGIAAIILIHVDWIAGWSKMEEVRRSKNWTYEALEEKPSDQYDTKVRYIDL